MITPIISYDIVNNFTEESILGYLKKTYSVELKQDKILPDPTWYGRGAVDIDPKELEKIPSNWEDSLSEGFGELEFIEEEESD